MNARARVIFSLCLSIGTAGCERHLVPRSADGEVKLGRFIPGAAYEAYARAAVAEQDGHLAEAEAELRRAAELDDGPETWARLGAVLCKRGRVEESADAFSRAVESDPEASITERELARCALSQDRASAAVEITGRAMLLDPSDDDILAIRADALSKTGDRAGALRLLVSRVVARPAPAELRRRLAALAAELGDTAAARIASDAPPSIAWNDPKERALAAPAPRPTLADLDGALLAGDRQLRHLALRAGVSQGELALRACALGLPRAATELSETLAAADPSNAAAVVARAAASDLSADEGALAAAVRVQVDAPAVPLSGLGRLVLAELLARRVDRDAAAAVVAGELEVPRADALEEAVRVRVRARLGR